MRWTLSFIFLLFLHTIPVYFAGALELVHRTASVGFELNQFSFHGMWSMEVMVRCEHFPESACMDVESSIAPCRFLTRFVLFSGFLAT